MAKRFIRISLAVKFRLLFGPALLVVIGAALMVPWYFMEVLSEQSVEAPTRELTRLRLAEWQRVHQKNLTDAHKNSRVVELYTAGKRSAGEAVSPHAPFDPEAEIREGPVFRIINVSLPKKDLDRPAQKARKFFVKNPEKRVVWRKARNMQDKPVYRGFRAVRNTAACNECHKDNRKPALRFAPGQLIGLIDVTLPTSAASVSQLWWARSAIIAGGVFAVVLALVIFSVIAHRIVLRPVRKLRELSDKVADGDMTVRSSLRTGDEWQRLGESFNEMLTAITDQHNKLRAANRAVELNLIEMGERNLALFEANQVKTEFLANISHELRTPLNSIIGFADLLCESEEERTARYGTNVSTAAKNLLAMINDMLDLAKIEAGKANVRFDKVSAIDSCQTILTLMQPLADKKNITLLAAIDAKTPIISTDGGKLQQILFNLVSNAIKFTPSGGMVTLSVQPSESRGASLPEEVLFAIADTGPGISEADQAHIFEKFYQVDPTLTKETTGTGLGLAICKELAMLLGGKLSLHSATGEGTTFSLTLPIREKQ
ncbi:MAG: HAMP domain-containing histidine kinase [Phycisphaerae bacterium]|nr:HAMP domain-containing histidine kinase [Phycisphaerae bacterium]